MIADPAKRREAMLQDIGALVRGFRRKYGADMWDNIRVLATTLATFTNIPTDPGMRALAEQFARERLQEAQHHLVLTDDQHAAGSA